MISVLLTKIGLISNRGSIYLLKDLRENRFALVNCLLALLSFTKMQSYRILSWQNGFLSEEPGTHDPAAQKAPALAQSTSGRGTDSARPLLAVRKNYTSQNPWVLLRTTFPRGDSDSPWGSRTCVGFAAGVKGLPAWGRPRQHLGQVPTWSSCLAVAVPEHTTCCPRNPRRPGRG